MPLREPAEVDDDLAVFAQAQPRLHQVLEDRESLLLQADPAPRGLRYGRPMIS
ncbi:hypothetical protein OG799_12845 [Micromonospora sp. NBC_00898]|nr:hypothetical protein OG799_12845 [Micromonospora sp. NBC_00898]